MTKQQKMEKPTLSGFTIIEVVLVLAIAGLIFLMVFIALPAMQRSQRNTQRRDDYANLSTYVTNYMTNHNGSLPSGSINASSVNETFEDPSKGSSYTITVQSTVPTNAPAEGTVYVITGAKCNAGKPDKNGVTNKRAFAIYGYLEGDTFCSASQ